MWEGITPFGFGAEIEPFSGGLISLASAAMHLTVHSGEGGGGSIHQPLPQQPTTNQRLDTFVSFAAGQNALAQVRNMLAIADTMIDTVIYELGFERATMTASDFNMVRLGITYSLIEILVPTAGFGNANIRTLARTSFLLTHAGTTISTLNSDFFFTMARAQTAFAMFVISCILATGSIVLAGVKMGYAAVMVTGGVASFVFAGPGWGPPLAIGFSLAAAQSLAVSAVYVVIGVTFIALAEMAWESFMLNIEIAKSVGITHVENELDEIAGSHGIGECAEAVEAMVEHLRIRRQNYERVSVDFRLPVSVYSAIRLDLDSISLSGFHIGLLFNGIVRCTVHPLGLPLHAWINDFVVCGTSYPNALGRVLPSQYQNFKTVHHLADIFWD
jgi:hypothetical protein